ncbi:MAG: polyphenol oxidase family protein [Elusimicrobia bacterium]|nr:polyphenol oxidase family protein [Elusimicrobiota bacterium]
MWVKNRDLYQEDRLQALGIAHGVTTRILGDMKVLEKRIGFFRSFGIQDQPVFLKQIHSAKVIRSSQLNGSSIEGDAWILNNRGRGSGDKDQVVGIWVADCLPVFFWNREGDIVGLAHMGWRGIAQGLAGVMVEEFGKEGVAAEDISAAVGPHILHCCFRVGPEVAQKFPVDSTVVREGETTYVNLSEEVRRQLEEHGVPEENVTFSLKCTACLPEEFFSYRREKLDLRMMAFLCLKH